METAKLDGSFAVRCAQSWPIALPQGQDRRALRIGCYLRAMTVVCRPEAFCFPTRCCLRVFDCRCEFAD